MSILIMSSPICDNSRMHVRCILERLNVRTRIGVLVTVALRSPDAAPDDAEGGALE